ncbi:BZ3500_MvSof-1268-A1-R1_Chr7-1g09038 [Microbotryum saponariae]|uniref:BZ3500_MvSof-1268-A1-R1_Chr7-1g09038 protein n=1 Tax=Microbotryum saponariae TaxID=289078 RepID=A0A2X0NBT5_9BASI|nr:BZ3501_MvSof-1269-A2-R1_Chr7-1g08742 [Microbotryum saponariae]SDA02676.1 BZ3500_MvSof-1268-A1-R1_Chr7-1g09038 [Microbotryum saponariae]
MPNVARTSLLARIDHSQSPSESLARGVGPYIGVALRGREQRLGQQGDGVFEVLTGPRAGASEQEKEVVATIALEAKTARNLKSLYEKTHKAAGLIWPALKSTLDIRIFKEANLADTLQCGSAMASKVRSPRLARLGP